MKLPGLATAMTLVPALLLAQAPARPLDALPYTPSLEPLSMDRSIDPCEDFYTYACGGWIRRNPIPPDQARWSVYGKLNTENEQFLWGLLEEAAKPRPGRTAAEQRIGDAFASCMDEAAIEERGTAPLADDLAAITRLRSVSELPALLARLHPTLGGSGMLFGFGAEPDPGDSSRVIAWATAGGLGLPDRDYYLNDDERSRETRERYREHVVAMLRLLGDEPEAARRAADRVLRLETALARASLSRVDRRDPLKVYHPASRAELQELTPSFRWDAYLSGLGRPEVRSLNVTQPEFYRAVEALLASEPLDVWKDYLRWHLVDERAPYLPAAFVEADFAFHRGYLRGVKQNLPRWKQCVRIVDRDLGEALGQVFVDRAFPPEVKADTVEMARNVQRAMERRLRALPWMGAATKKEALAKLGALRNKVGYPDTWREYGGLEVRRGDFLGNAVRGLRFETMRRLDRIGRPVDRGEWSMTPPTVNAYYHPMLNDMNFPAGILLPPLYDPKMDAAPNYGNTGSTIGHELTHGFDDSGRKFDAKGSLRDWWTPEDAKRFEERAACISDQYSGYVAVDDVKVNGKLTLGEDVADLGGTILAWEAWQAATAGRSPEPRDGLTPEQRFFVGFAQWACASETAESARLNALTDPHSPPRYRINGVVVNMPEFARAFGCEAGDAMVKPVEEVCRVW